MNRPTVIVTGLIGSGKSAVCALLRERGIPVYDCDSRAKRLYDRKPSLVTHLEEILGMPLREPGGRLDRKRLAAVIFGDPSAREKVEAVLYPEVLRDFKRWRSRQKGAPYVVLESAVILSKPVFDGIAQAVVLVEAPMEKRLRRVMERDAATDSEVLQRMKAQSLPREKVNLVLENSGTLQELEHLTEQVFFDKNSYLCKILNLEV